MAWAQCPSADASGPTQHQMWPSSWSATATKLSAESTPPSFAGNRKIAIEPSPGDRVRNEFVRAVTTVSTMSAGAFATSSRVERPRVAAAHSLTRVRVRTSTSRSRAAESEASGRAVTPSTWSFTPATLMRAVKCVAGIG